MLVAKSPAPCWAHNRSGATRMTMTAERPETGFGLNPQDELNDLRMSEKAVPLLNKVKDFIRDVVEPMSVEFHRLGEGRPDVWQYAPGQLEVLEKAKDKAKAEGLWNFFLPHAETGEGLSNLDYAYIAVELGKNRTAFAMTEVNAASSDAKNINTRATLVGDEYVINGEKHYISGAGDPRC